MRKRFTHFFLLLTTIGLTLFVPFRISNNLNNGKINDQAIIHASGFYNDAFYYLNYAQNNKAIEYNSFDNELPSNGYHFLWQAIVNHLAKITSSKSELINSVFYLCLLLTLFAYLFVVHIVYQITRSFGLSLFTIFPGFFYLLFSLGLGIHYSPWVLINGLESSLSLFFFSAILYLSYLFFKDNLTIEKYVFILSFLIVLLFLSRLDEGFILIGFVTALLLRPEQKLRLILLLVVVPIIAIALYLLYNYYNYGLLLPVSGIVKSSFYPENLIHIFNCLTTGRSILNLSSEHLFSRVLPLLLPLIAVPLLSRYFLKLNNEPQKAKIQLLLNAINVYVIVKSLYLLFFVDFWLHGQWYFYNQIILMNIYIAILIYLKFSVIIRNHAFNITSFVLILLITNMIFFKTVTGIEDSNQLNKYDYNRINKLISDKIPDGKIIEMDDGIIAFSCDNSCLSGFCLAGDKLLYEKFKKDKLLEEAYRRGYRYLASVNYFKNPRYLADTINKLSDFIQEPFRYSNQFDDSKWSYELILKDSISNLILIKFEKR